MLKTRVIPVLLLREGALVKTTKFNKYKYIGDPCNTVRIFNELEVDELILLDILATRRRIKPDLKLLSEIASECFMPLTFGGGIKSIMDIKEILNIGYEKVAINSHAVEDRLFVSEAVAKYGSQCIIGSIDIKRNIWKKHKVYITDGTYRTKLDPVEWAIELEQLGCGELLVTSIDRDGTWEGYDLDLIKRISSVVNIPVIANGGAGKTSDIGDVVKKADASAVGLGSMVVYQKKGMGVLVNFPDKIVLEKELMSY